MHTIAYLPQKHFHRPNTIAQNKHTHIPRTDTLFTHLLTPYVPPYIPPYIPMTAQTLHQQHITTVLLNALERSTATRTEALRDFFTLNAISRDSQEGEALAALTPALLPSLYKKWIALFSTRLLETIPADQLSELCNGTPENNAALTLTYLMFLESERMEKQIEKDLKAYALEQTGNADNGDTLAAYIRARMEMLAAKLKS